MDGHDLVFAVIGDVRLSGPANEKALDGVVPQLKTLGVEAVVVCSAGGAVRLVPLADDQPFSAAVRKAFEEKTEAVDVIRFRGFDFVLNNVKRLSRMSANALASAHADILKGTKSFFYFQRQHPRGTCAGDFVAEQDDGVATAFLKGRANAVAFSVGAKAPLYDERSIRQGDFGFTAVQVSSFHTPHPFGGHENALPYGRSAADYRDDLQMPDLADHAVQHRPAVVVSVRDGRCVLSRWSLARGKRLGEDWSVSPDAYGAYAYEARRKTCPVPAFATGACPSVRTGRGKTLKGMDAEQVTVSFPKAVGSRAYDYLVTVHFIQDGIDVVVAERRVYSTGIFGPPDEEPDRVDCVFAKAELFQDAWLTFEVRALNAFGAQSAPISCRGKVPSNVDWRG